MAYPFPIEKLPSPAWIKENVAVSPMRVDDLTPTQYYLVIDRLLWIQDGGDPDGGDVPHVVEWQGSTYLYDGHHRWMHAKLTGLTVLLVRRVTFD